tara:strand:- start:148 stop:438 length:291 start_codon:yes stop_codon:yes gene_type:complete
MSIKLISAINSSPRDKNAVWVQVAMKDSNTVYKGYIMEESNMLGEPSIRIFVIESTGVYSGHSTFIAKSKCDIKILPGVHNERDLQDYKEIKWVRS